MRRIKKSALPLGYKVKDANGEWKPDPAHRIMRPITDPKWNAKQCGKRVRMSKKERIKSRHAFKKAIEKKAEEKS